MDPIRSLIVNIDKVCSLEDALLGYLALSIVVPLAVRSPSRFRVLISTCVLSAYLIARIFNLNRVPR